MDQKDKHGIGNEGRKPRSDGGDSRGQQGQQDRSRNSESAGRPTQASQSQPGQQQPRQQQTGQHQAPGQQQHAGTPQATERRQESAPTGHGTGNRSQQGGPDRDKDRQR